MLLNDGRTIPQVGFGVFKVTADQAKSGHPDRIADNIRLFDFLLTDDEMATIAALDRGERAGPDPSR